MSHTQRTMGWLIGISSVVLLALILAPLIFAWLLALKLVRPERKAFTDHPRTYALSHEEVSIPSPVGKLAAWYLPGTNGRTLICLHGIGDNRQQWLAPAADLQKRGYSLLLLDFRAHGESEGHYSTYGDRETEDVLAALDYLAQRGDVAMDRIGLMGLSLGGISAIIAASRTDRVHAVMAESAFPDLLRDIKLAFRRYTGLPPFLIADLTVLWGQILVGTNLRALRPVQVIDRIAPRPVFIIGDLQDDLVDEPHGSTWLYERAREPKQLWQLPEAGHVAAYKVAPLEYIDRLDAFFSQAL